MKKWQKPQLKKLTELMQEYCGYHAQALAK
jgi:hypothetical protein